MPYTSQTSDVSVDWGLTTVTTVVFVLLTTFWLSVGLTMIDVSVPLVRAILGVVIVTLVPGALLTELLGIRTTDVGEFVTVAVGLSLVALSITTVLASVALPVVGVSEPLSFLPLAVVVTALVSALTLLLWVATEDPFRIGVPVTNSLPVYALLGLLTVFAVSGAVLMNRYDVNVGIGLFVLVAAVVTVLSATRVIRPTQYPAVVFSVALSVMLHRSLATTHVVGADIQFTYFLAERIAENHQWAPDIGGSISSLPVVTAVPVAYTAVAGLDLSTVFIVVFPVVFSIVPVGIYSLTRDVFDPAVALYGSLFFVFYHGTFYLTPGKQRLSELFVVGLLLLFFRRAGRTRSRGEAVAAVLLAIGVIHSHYGSTYVFGISALVAAIGLVLAEWFLRDGEVRCGLLPVYPLVFLAGATAWYAYSSNALIASLASIPVSVFVQLATLPEGIAAGSGSSYVSSQETILQQVTLYVYLLLSMLICLGLAWRTVDHLIRLRRGTDTGDIKFTALAIPLCAFLASSYVLVLDLWADRVYQMVLPVLAAFAALGYLLLGTAAERVSGSVSLNWTPLAIALAVLFVINAGLAGAIMGSPTDYTFDEDAHDYAFSEDERRAAEWFEDRPEVERTGPMAAAAPNGSANATDEEIPIYTDRITSQLFRSVIPESHYNVKVIMVKDEWNRTFDPNETRGGYVFIRHNAISDSDPDDTPLQSLSAEHVDELTDNRPVAYENDDVTILEPAATNETATNETDETASLGTVRHGSDVQTDRFHP